MVPFSLADRPPIPAHAEPLPWHQEPARTWLPGPIRAGSPDAAEVRRVPELSPAKPERDGLLVPLSPPRLVQPHRPMAPRGSGS